VPEKIDLTIGDGTEDTVMTDNTVTIDRNSASSLARRTTSKMIRSRSQSRPIRLSARPKKDRPAIKAKESEPCTPDETITKLVGGDTFEVVQSAKLRDLIG
jgi:hypothetical protein